MSNWSIIAIVFAGTIVISAIAITLLIRSNLARRGQRTKWDWWHDEKYFDLPVKGVIPGRNGRPDIEVRHWTDIPTVFTKRDSHLGKESDREMDA